MGARARVPGIVTATAAKMSILLATLQAEHFRLLPPPPRVDVVTAGRRGLGPPDAVLPVRRSRWRTRAHVWPAPCRGRRRDCGD